MASYSKNYNMKNQDNDDDYPENSSNEEDNYPENSSNEENENDDDNYDEQDDRDEFFEAQEVQYRVPEFDEQFIPGNSIVERYNQEFYNILKQIPEIKRSFRNINEYIQQHIIPPQYVVVAGRGISLKSYDAIKYVVEQSWGTDQTIARLLVAAIHIGSIFNWNTVYSPDWQQELLTYGI